MTYFSVKRRVIGPGWQVRVRTSDGHEDTVDILYTLAKAQEIYDHLQAEGFRPLSAKPTA